MLVGLGVRSGFQVARENRDQPAVAGIEVEVVLLGIIQIGLLEHQRHAEHAFPKVDRGLPVGPDERDMMHALRLNALLTTSLILLAI